MKTIPSLVLVASALFAVASVQAAAVAFASRASFVSTYPGASVENWDSYAVGTTVANGASLGGITYNSSTGISIVTSQFLTSTGANGLGRTPTEFFDVADQITFTFGSALTAFGIDINTFATTNGAYSLTTNTGEVIASVFDPFANANTGQFAGFVSNVAFTSVTVKSLSDVSSLDTLRFVTANGGGGRTPDGGLTIALFGSAFAALLAFRRKLA